MKNYLFFFNLIISKSKNLQKNFKWFNVYTIFKKIDSNNRRFFNFLKLQIIIR